MEQMQPDWPYRLYGPSNWGERKSQLIPAGITIDEGRKFVRMEVWYAWNLNRQQSCIAFENSEISPDALAHVTSIISCAIGKGGQLERQSALEKLKHDTRIHNLIVWGLLQSKEIPDSYLIQKGHPALLAKDINSTKLLLFVFDSDFRVERSNWYLWENVERMLRVTAKYLDSRRRIQAEPATEADPDLPN